MKSFERIKLKYVADYIQRGNAPTYVESNGVPVINQACVQASSVDQLKIKFHDPEDIDRITSWLQQDDVLINSTGTGTLGRVAHVREEPMLPMFADGHVTIIRDSARRFVPRYLFYVLSVQQEQVTVECAEGATNQIELSRHRLGNKYIDWLSTATQRQVVTLLDQRIGTLDKLIAGKKHLLDLLAEKRRALITRVVTQGLNPTAQLRDSGIPCLGKIPGHWEAIRLKYLISRLEQGWSPQCYSYPATEGGFGVLKTGCVNGGEFRESQNKMLPPEMVPPDGIEIAVGDILMSRASGSIALIGSVALVTKQPKARLLLSDKIFRLSGVQDRCTNFFLTLVMGAQPLRTQIQAMISGADGLANNISKSDVCELWLPVPPIDEQHAITTHVRREVKKLASLAEVTERTIALLQERRSALISAAVTGQLTKEEIHAGA